MSKLTKTIYLKKMTGVGRCTCKVHLQRGYFKSRGIINKAKGIKIPIRVDTTINHFKNLSLSCCKGKKT